MTSTMSADRRAKIYEERRSITGRRNAATADWSEERIALLTKLWGEGLSCSQIATEMGGNVTRNSVIGKVTRLKLPKRLVTHARANTSKRVPGAVPARRRPNTPRVPSNSTPRPPQVIVDTTPAPEAPASLCLPLIELTATTCRWPVGDPRQPGFGFCGHDIAEGSRYCPYHRARSVRGSTGAFVPGSVAVEAL